MTKDAWEARYALLDPFVTTTPAQVLLDYGHLLPTQGRALDLACGLGANACLLAERGLETVAWDRSLTAIQMLKTRAAAEGPKLMAEVRDVILYPPLPESFDVIVVSRFLDRALAPAISAALRSGGLLFYQTFGAPLVDPERGPRSSHFRLLDEELPQLFPTLRLRVYRDEGGIGDTLVGLRDEVYGVFERPAS